MFWPHRWGHRRWHRRMWRRHYWRPRPFFWFGPGCGCLLPILLGMFVLFACIASMCSGPWHGYYW